MMKHVETATQKRLETSAARDDIVSKVKQALSKELKISVWKELGDYETGYASTPLFSKRYTLERKTRDALYSAAPELDWGSEVYKLDNRMVGLIVLTGSTPDDSEIEDIFIQVHVNVLTSHVAFNVD